LIGDAALLQPRRASALRAAKAAALQNSVVAQGPKDDFKRIAGGVDDAAKQ
jgi:hypothetical protein